MPFTNFNLYLCFEQELSLSKYALKKASRNSFLKNIAISNNAHSPLKALQASYYRDEEKKLKAESEDQHAALAAAAAKIKHQELELVHQYLIRAGFVTEARLERIKNVFKCFSDDFADIQRGWATEIAIVDESPVPQAGKGKPFAKPTKIPPACLFLADNPSLLSFIKHSSIWRVMGAKDPFDALSSNKSYACSLDSSLASYESLINKFDNIILSNVYTFNDTESKEFGSMLSNYLFSKSMRSDEGFAKFKKFIGWENFIKSKHWHLRIDAIRLESGLAETRVSDIDYSWAIMEATESKLFTEEEAQWVVYHYFCQFVTAGKKKCGEPHTIYTKNELNDLQAKVKQAGKKTPTKPNPTKPKPTPTKPKPSLTPPKPSKIHQGFTALPFRYKWSIANMIGIASLGTASIMLPVAIISAKGINITIQTIYEIIVSNILDIVYPFFNQ